MYVEIEKESNVNKCIMLIILTIFFVCGTIFGRRDSL